MELTEQQEKEFLEMYNLEKTLEHYIKKFYIGASYDIQKLSYMWFMNNKLFDIIILMSIQEVLENNYVISNWLKYILTVPFKHISIVPTFMARLKNKGGIIFYDNDNNIINRYSTNNIKEFFSAKGINIEKVLDISDKSIDKYLKFHSIKYDMLKAQKDYQEYLKYMPYLYDIDILFDLDTLRQIKI